MEQHHQRRTGGSLRTEWHWLDLHAPGKVRAAMELEEIRSLPPELK